MKKLRAVHLKKLLKHCIEFDDTFDRLLQECTSLNEYISEGRYPGDLPWEMIGEQDAKEAIEAADKIAEFVSGKIIFEK